MLYPVDYWFFCFLVYQMRQTILLALGILFSGFIRAQGCSDAGVCTIGSLKNHHISDTIYSSLSISNTSGFGEAGGSIIYVQTSLIEGKLRIYKNGYLNLKIPVKLAFGNLGNTAGPGDIALSYSHRLLKREDRHLIFTIGGIFPSNDSDKKEDGLPLPMYYQSSLGSYDIIIGSSYSISLWQLVMGYQHPFNRNKNGFLHNFWPDESRATDYFESNQLKRGDDLVLRISRSFPKGRRTIVVGLLPIYRLQKDQIIRNGQVEKLAGSDQLTLNLNFDYLYQLTHGLNFRFSYAHPVIWRETRADGLTRQVVFTLALELRL